MHSHDDHKTDEHKSRIERERSLIVSQLFIDNHSVDITVHHRSTPS